MISSRADKTPNGDIDKTSDSDIDETSKGDIDETSNGDTDETSNDDIDKTSNGDIDETSNGDIDKTSNDDIDAISNGDTDKTSNGDIDKTSHGDIDETWNGDFDEIWNGDIDETSNGDIDKTSNGNTDETSNGDIDKTSNGDIDGTSNGDIDETAWVNLYLRGYYSKNFWMTKTKNFFASSRNFLISEAWMVGFRFLKTCFAAKPTLMLFARKNLASCCKSTFSNLQTLFSRTSGWATFYNRHFTIVFSFSYRKGARGFSAWNMIKTGSRSFIMHKENSRAASNVQQLKAFLIPSTRSSFWGIFLFSPSHTKYFI